MPGDILTALQSGAKLASQLMDEKTRINNELTEADYNDQQYKFNDAFKSMMLDFENRPDYENFQQEYDDFFTQWKDQVNANAKTGRSAKLLSDMVDSTYQQYKFGLEQSVINSQRSSVRSLHNEDKERVKNDTMMTTEEKVADILETNNSDYRSGNFTSAQEYEKTTLNDITDAIMGDAKNIGLNIIAAGGSLEDAYAAASTAVDKDLNITMLQAGTLADEDRSGSLNRDGMKTQLRNEMTTYWNTVVKEKQDHNKTILSQYYSSLLQLSGNDLIAGITKAYEALNSMTGNDLKAEDRDMYSRYFKNLMESVETGDGKTASGNNAAKTALYTDILTDDNLYPFFEAAANGNYEDLYCMKEAIQNADYNYTRKQYKEIYGKDLSVEEYATAKAKALGNVMNKMKASGLLPAEADVVLNNSKKLLDEMINRQFGMKSEDYFKGKGQYFSVVIAKVEELAADLVYQCNIGDQSQLDKLIPDFENRVNAMFLDGLDFSMEQKWNENPDKALARSVEALSNEASAVTLNDNGKSRTVYAPGAEEAKGQVCQSLADRVSDYTGISKDHLTLLDDRTEHDMTANPILSDSKGNYYKYESKDGKLSVMTKHGNGDWKEMQDPKKAASSEPKANVWEGVDDSVKSVIKWKVASGAVPDVVPDNGSTYQLTQMNAQKWSLLSDEEKYELLIQMATSDEPVFTNKFKAYINK